jgi:DNA gyrase inhibitor GyrI
MVKKVIPASRYAVFNYNISNGTLNNTKIEMPVYRYIDGVWLPNSGIEMSDNPDFEIVNKNENQVLYHISLN